MSQLGHGVHRADRALGHRQQQRPFRVLGANVVDKGRGDKGVLDQSVEQGLLRHLAENGDRRSQGLGERGENLRLGGQRLLGVGGFVFVAPRAPGNDHQSVRGVPSGGRRFDHIELVFPGNVTPGLRGQDEFKVGCTAEGALIAYGPAVAVVGFRNVLGQRAVERWFVSHNGHKTPEGKCG